MAETGWAGQVDRWVRSQPWFVLAILVTVFLSTSLSLVKYGSDFVGWVQDRRVNWQDAEYVKLASLGAGINASLFDQTLGAPTFIRTVDGLTEKSYRGHGYWVQTVENPSGGVILMAVTSCTPDFNPKFQTPVGRVVELNETTFAEFQPKGSTPRSEYFLSGATANSSFYDIYPSGNPSYYQTTWVGINDACGWDRGVMTGGWPFEYVGLTTDGGPAVESFRVAAKVNTYAVSAPHADPPPPFQVGVDRILIRTVRPK